MSGGGEPSAATTVVDDGYRSSRGRQLARNLRSIEAAALAGVLYAVVAIVALGLFDYFPDPGQPESEIQDWFDGAGNRSALILACNLVAISSILFLWFVAVTRRRLGDHEDRFFGTVFFGSAIAFVAVWLATGAALAAPAVAAFDHGGEAVSSESVSLAHGLGEALLLIVAPRMQAVFVMVTSTLFYRSRVLPAWVGIIGLCVAIVLFVVPLVSDPLGYAFPIWVLLVSLVIIVARRRSDTLEVPTG